MLQLEQELDEWQVSSAGGLTAARLSRLVDAKRRDVGERSTFGVAATMAVRRQVAATPPHLLHFPICPTPAPFASFRFSFS